MSEKLTVIIPCKNEQTNILACIESARLVADEFLIADSGSTDGTLDIVRQMPGCRIIQREYVTSGDFKNWAIPQASHPWVLIIDADERVPLELADEVLAMLKSDPECDGYRIYRNNHFMGHPARSCGWNNDWVLRLFRRDMGRYEGPSDHGRVKIPSGKVGQLEARFLHYTYWSYDQYFQKLDRYSKTAAKEWFEAGRRSPSFRTMTVRATWRFFRQYILQRGFTEGRIGLQIAVTSAFYSFMKQARLWELHHALGQSEVAYQHRGNGHESIAGAIELDESEPLIVPLHQFRRDELKRAA